MRQLNNIFCISVANVSLNLHISDQIPSTAIGQWLWFNKKGKLTSLAALVYSGSFLIRKTAPKLSHLFALLNLTYV